MDFSLCLPFRSDISHDFQISSFVIVKKCDKETRISSLCRSYLLIILNIALVLSFHGLYKYITVLDLEKDLSFSLAKHFKTFYDMH